jgi:hypothetical protein
MNIAVPLPISIPKDIFEYKLSTISSSHLMSSNVTDVVDFAQKWYMVD